MNWSFGKWIPYAMELFQMLIPLDNNKHGCYSHRKSFKYWEVIKLTVADKSFLNSNCHLKVQILSLVQILSHFL